MFHVDGLHRVQRLTLQNMPETIKPGMSKSNPILVNTWQSKIKIKTIMSDK